MALQTKISVLLSALLEAVADIGTVKHQLTNYGPDITLSTGTGANQADKMFADTRTIAASGNEALDLAGTLLDGFGAVCTFARVKVLLIKAAAANTNNVIVGGAAANGWITAFGDATDKIVVRPGGFVLLVAPDVTGYAVTAGTADQLKIENSGAGTGVTYDVVIIGTSA